MTALERFRTKGIIPRAVLYARFSSDNQREESIEAQLRALYEYCQRNGVVVVREYCDRAKSATTDDRPEFLSMVSDSRQGDFNFAIVHKLDRFSRNRYDSAYYKRELKKNGVTLLSVLEHMDDSPESIILESVLEGMSEYYSRNLAREVMKGMRESALQCRYLGGHIPFGYKVNPKTYKFEVNDEEADAVRTIFRRVSEGVGYSSIILELNLLGYKTRFGNSFGKNSITEILRNEKYKGVYIFNRTVSKNSFGCRNNHMSKSEDEIIRIDGGMPAIVDEEIFDQVNKIIKGRTHVMPHKRAIESYLLTGKVFCGICGSSYNGNRQFSGRNKNLLVTYRCGNRKHQGDRHCDNKDINRDYLETFVINRVGEVVFHESRISELISEYNRQSDVILTDNQKKLHKLQSKQKEIEQKIQNIISVISNTGSPTLLDTLNSLEYEKQETEQLIKQEEAHLASNGLDEQKIIEAYKYAQKLYHMGSLEQKKQLINLYLNKVLVFPEYVEITLNNVPATLINVAVKTQTTPVLTDARCSIHIVQIINVRRYKMYKKIEQIRFIAEADMSKCGGGEGN